MKIVFLILICFLLMISCKNNASQGFASADSATIDCDSIEEVFTDRSTDSLTSLSDTLYPKRVWNFNLADSVFPTEKNGVFIDGHIKGFDTDWNGNFYILGDDPVRLVCYHGNEVVFNRRVGDVYIQQGLFKLIGDSIWFVDEYSKSILRIHKSGEGKIDRFALPIGDKDSIVGGYLYDKHFFIETEPYPKYYNSYTERIANTRGYWMKYPNKMYDVVVSEGKVLNKINNDDKIPEEVIKKHPYDFHFRITPQHIITTECEAFVKEVSLFDNEGNEIYTRPMSTLKISAYCQSYYEGCYPTKSLYRHKGNRFMFMCYEGTHLQIYEFDLNPN